MSEPTEEAEVCSARGCRAAATWLHAWNNPRLHAPDRRKTWLACDEHREHLGRFLASRGFLRETVALPEWKRRESPEGDVPTS